MVDKLIRGKIIEIVVVLIFVIISIPLWDSFEKKISAAEVTTMEDYNMNFEVYNTNNKDRIVVTNEYYINKNYKILLVVNNTLNQESSSVVINETEYNLSEFHKEQNKNNYVYTLVNDYITADINYYDIKPNIDGNNNNYSYRFEEKVNF